MLLDLVFFFVGRKGGINHYGAWRVFFWGWGLDFGRDKDLFVGAVGCVVWNQIGFGSEIPP